MALSDVPVIRHATVALPALDVVAAAARLGLPLWAWSRSASGELWAAFGEACVLTAEDLPSAGRLVDQLSGWQPLDPQPPPGPWLGHVAFDARRLWDGWPAARFVVPRGIFWARDGRFHATALTLGEDAPLLEHTLATMMATAHVPTGRAAAPSPHTPAAPSPAERREWGHLMEECLARLGKGGISKVVPARRIVLELPSSPDAVTLLGGLQRDYPGCQAYLLSGPRGEVFAGATPETLCRVDGNSVQVDALAGSAPLHRATALLDATKERAEHAFVLDAVLSTLRELCVDVQHPPVPALLRLSNIAHLHTPVRARLRNGIGAGALLAALHPTPAVAGTPRQAAMDLLLKHEGFARGPYAGAVGLLGQGNAHLCVALRCARIMGRHAELFVGAGVVQGSDTQLEWEETDRKSRPMQQALWEATHGAP